MAVAAIATTAVMRNCILAGAGVLNSEGWKVLFSEVDWEKSIGLVIAIAILVVDDDGKGLTNGRCEGGLYTFLVPLF